MISSFRQLPRIVDVVNILLGIAIIAMLAVFIAENLSGRLEKSLSSRAPRTVKTSVPLTTRGEDLSAYAPILTSGLFGKATQGLLTPIVNAHSGSGPTTAPGELLLLGTATGSIRETFALVRHTTRQEERVFRLGENVFDAGRLVQVNKEHAFIVVNGSKVELMTPLSVAAAKPAKAGKAVQTGAGVTNMGTGSYVIDQRALNAALDNISQAMTDARLLPSMKDGKVEGFRALEVKPQGVFGMIGIRNGDVILRLNDFPINSPDKALQSFIALKGQSRLKLEMFRDGQPVTFNYDIR